MNQCAAEGCTTEVPSHKLMCHKHWFWLHQKTRAWIYREYRAGIPYNERGSVKAAIEEIKQIESKAENV